MADSALTFLHGLRHAAHVCAQYAHDPATVAGILFDAEDELARRGCVGHMDRESARAYIACLRSAWGS